MGIVEKVPPQAVEIEKNVLGSSLASPKVLSDLMECAKEEFFYSRQNRIIFNTMKTMYEINPHIDILLLAQELKRVEALTVVGGETYLAELLSETATVPNIDNYLGIMKEKEAERSWTQSGAEITAIAFGNASHAEKREAIQNAMASIDSSENGDSGLKHIRDIIPEASEHFKDTLDGKVSGIKTGIADFDRETGGLFLGEYTIVSGRPADGKTTVALNMARSIAEQGHAVGIFSIEMQGKKLTNRFACMIGDGSIRNSHIRGVDVPNTNALNEYMHSMDKLSKLDIYIDDSPKATNSSIMSSVRSFIRKNKLSVLIIDHFSLIAYEGENKRGQNYERKEEITRGIQKILKELDIAGVILVQLGRDAQNRRPRLSDLSDTKALEQDANNVLMIWNPVHGDKTRRVLCCEKGRDGGSGDYYINFEGDTAKTYSMEPLKQDDYYTEIEKNANHSHRG